MDMSATYQFLRSLLELRLHRSGVDVYSDRGQTWVEYALAVACVVALGIGVYVFVKNWIDNNNKSVPQAPVQSVPVSTP